MYNPEHKKYIKRELIQSFRSTESALSFISALEG